MNKDVAILLIGIDCATNDNRIGIALGKYAADTVEVIEAKVCSAEMSALASVAEWLRDLATPALLAIDAPLGWPQPMSRVLASHRAGNKIETVPNEMFRRATDRFIQKELRKTPLDVGADRIARTAHAALMLLGDLRLCLGLPIPLAWSPAFVELVAAIEVYPAATLVAHGLRSSGYKKQNQFEERKELIGQLGSNLEYISDLSVLERNADALDAVVCLLAARDFLAGRAMPPSDQITAEQEGWIWAAPRASE